MKIENHGEHLIALHELDRLMRSGDNGSRHKAEGPWVELLSESIEEYEQEHFPLGCPDTFICPTCGYRGACVLNESGDDIACAKCGGKLVAQ